MEEAKSAVKSHIARNGERETSVHEAKSVNPAVEHEYVQPAQHENVYQPVDREVHKDHHHTKVQPIKHKEVLPEKHTHVQEAPEKREIQHGSENHVKKRLKEEADTLGLHHNQKEVGKTHHTKAAAPTVEAEHVHHHVHEHIQPVIQKETVQPHVVHRTKPIHEVHQHEPEHHSASILPPVSLDEFQRQGGSVRGSEGERSDVFAGEPGRLDSGHIGGIGARGTTSLTHPDGEAGVGYHAPSTRRTTRGKTPETYGPDGVVHGVEDSPDGYGLSSERTPRYGGADSLSHASSRTSGAQGRSSVPRETPESRASRESTPSARHTSTTAEHHKPTLMEKLNPKKDANGDGKAGIMS